MNSAICVNKAAIIINLSASYYRLYLTVFLTSIDVTLFRHASFVTMLLSVPGRTRSLFTIFFFQNQTKGSNFFILPLPPLQTGRISHCYPGAALLCVTEFPALRPTIHCKVVKGRGKPRAATLIRIVGDLCLFGSRLTLTRMVPSSRCQHA
jgi:hypothetical protein